MSMYDAGPDDYDIVECPDCGGTAVQDDYGNIECCESDCDNNPSS